MFKKILFLFCLPFISLAGPDFQRIQQENCSPVSTRVPNSPSMEEKKTVEEGFHRNLSFVLDYGAAFGNLLALSSPISNTIGLCISTSLSGISMVGSLFSPYYDESTSKLLKTADASLGLFIPIVNMYAANAELPENKERLNTLALTLTIAKIGVSTTIHRQKEKALKDKAKKEK
ncbi:MAG: hypothetical protein ACK5PQ_01275 [Alphaproteobacteria bacterium]